MQRSATPGLTASILAAGRMPAQQRREDSNPATTTAAAAAATSAQTSSAAAADAPAAAAAAEAPSELLVTYTPELEALLVPYLSEYCRQQYG